MVLGNHDLHLLAVYAGIKKVKKQDQLNALLNADDVEELINWLAQQPLLQKIGNDDAYMSHAGISPQWTLTEAIEQADFVHQRLNSPERNTWLSSMYGEKPNNWSQAKSKIDKFRYTINAFTRMRYCFKNKNLEFETKSSPLAIHNNQKVDTTLLPWYELSSTIDKTPWVFGHWAALMGECSHQNIYPLDTGCVWGNHLTMLRWHDKKVFTEQSHQH